MILGREFLAQGASVLSGRNKKCGLRGGCPLLKLPSLKLGGCPSFAQLRFPASFIETRWVSFINRGGCPLSIGGCPNRWVSHLSRSVSHLSHLSCSGCPTFLLVGVPPFSLVGVPPFLYRKSNPEIYFKSERIIFKISLIEHYLYKNFAILVGLRTASRAATAPTPRLCRAQFSKLLLRRRAQFSDGALALGRMRMEGMSARFRICLSLPTVAVEVVRLKSKISM